MSVIEALVLGVVQGLSEFLPISSSGHLEIVRWLMGWDELPDDTETAFDVAVHLGTLVGAVAYLRADVARYAAAGLASVRDRGPLTADGRTAWALVVSAVPAGAVGVALADEIAGFDSIAAVAVLLAGFGLVLLAADRAPQRRDESDFGFGHALAMGLGQALALAPGVSRSGITMTVGRGLGYTRAAAARLAFLMSLPVIAGAGVFSLVGASIPSAFWVPFAAGALASAVTGWLAVWGTLRVVSRVGLLPFVVYRVAVGLAVLGLLATPWR